MQITINGESRTLSTPQTVAALLDSLGLSGRLAVEVNGQILPRSQHSEYHLALGDRIEIVRAIGGG